MAAAALYKACLETKDKRVQKEVAEAAGTTEVTLRNRLRGLEALFLQAPIMQDD
jgi:transcription initiation factor TFIIB